MLRDIKGSSRSWRALGMLLMKVTDVLIITEKTSSKSHQSYQPETVLHRTSLYHTGKRTNNRFWNSWLTIFLGIKRQKISLLMKKVLVSSIQLLFFFLRYRDESFWRHNCTLPLPILSRPISIVVRSGSKNLEPARISAGIVKKYKGCHVTQMQWYLRRCFDMNERLFYEKKRAK